MHLISRSRRIHSDVTCNLQTLSFAAPAPKAEEKKKP